MKYIVTPSTNAMATTKAIAHENQPVVSTANISVPFDWLFGVTLTTSALFFSVIWWVRGIKAQVDNNGNALKTMGEHLAKERLDDRDERKAIRKEVAEGLRKDIAQSASDICHGFELFAVEIRSEIKKLGEGLDARNATVNRLGRKVDHLSNELNAMERQLNAQNIFVHSRDFRDDPSSSGNLNGQGTD